MDADKVELKKSLTKIRAEIAARKKESDDDLDFIKVCDKKILEAREKVALQRREVEILERKRHAVAQILKRKRNK